jgi:CO/xanthine dehydrogenase Mo-binding subunit
MKLPRFDYASPTTVQEAVALLLGAKGAGEGGIVPVGGVIANAVASALGVQPNALPLTPSRVWELINP